MCECLEGILGAIDNNESKRNKRNKRYKRNKMNRNVAIEETRTEKGVMNTRAAVSIRV